MFATVLFGHLQINAILTSSVRVHTIGESCGSSREKSLWKVMGIYAGKQQKCLRSEFGRGMITVLNSVKVVVRVS